MPGTPMRPLKMVMEKIIQNPERPVESPRILGPRKLPSNCCKIRTKMPTAIARGGSMSSVIRMAGIAPINGPKYGIIFVTPIIRLRISG